jgi:hypothetical protein
MPTESRMYPYRHAATQTDGIDDLADLYWPTGSRIHRYRHEAAQTDGIDDLTDLMYSLSKAHELFEKLTRHLYAQSCGPSSDATRKFNRE